MMTKAHQPRVGKPVAESAEQAAPYFSLEKAGAE